MPVFAYEALTPDGRKIGGEIEAVDQRAAIRRLHDDGLIPIGARPAERRAAAAAGGGLRLDRGALERGVTEFTREFATLLASGQTVEEALRLLVETTEQRRLRRILGRVLERVRGGRALSEALAEWPRAFPRFYVAMVRAGEAAGRLERATAELAILRERSEALTRKLQSALIYPTLLFVVALAALVLLLTVVVPSFSPLFASMGERLPWNTRLVLALSQGLERDGPTVLVVLLLVVLLAGQVLRREAPRRAVDGVLLRLPLLGRVARERVTARFARGLASLLEGGLDLPSALLLARDMVGNRHAARALDGVVHQIRQGRTLAAALAEADVLAPAALRMLRVGEEGGRLKEVARHVADAFEERTAARLTRLVALVEPATIVVMGILVGAIVLSILGAVMSVYDVAR